MLVQAYAVYDVKSEVFHMPFFAHNVKDGMRIFHRMLTSNDVYKGYEEDYRLYHIGSYDDREGILGPCENGKCTFIISANDCLGKKAATDNEQ